jgi:hypothetical protein
MALIQNLFGETLVLFVLDVREETCCDGYKVMAKQTCSTVSNWFQVLNGMRNKSTEQDKCTLIKRHSKRVDCLSILDAKLP